MLIQDPSGKWTKLNATVARPLPAGSALRISLINRQSVSFGLAGSYNSSHTISFSPNGRYSKSAGVIAGSGSVQAAQGFSAGASSYQDQKTRGASAGGGNGQVTATSTSRGRGDANAGGSYKVSGYTLELDGDGGLVQRVLAFYPFGGDNDSIYIDGVTYSRDTH